MSKKNKPAANVPQACRSQLKPKTIPSSPLKYCRFYDDPTIRTASEE